MSIIPVLVHKIVSTWPDEYRRNREREESARRSYAVAKEEEERRRSTTEPSEHEHKPKSRAEILMRQHPNYWLVDGTSEYSVRCVANE